MPFSLQQRHQLPLLFTIHTVRQRGNSPYILDKWIPSCPLCLLPTMSLAHYGHGALQAIRALWTISNRKVAKHKSATLNSHSIEGRSLDQLLVRIGIESGYVYLPCFPVDAHEQISFCSPYKIKEHKSSICKHSVLAHL